jgi:pimeloyl-ACP methyl ester carboxylesterase
MWVPQGTGPFPGVVIIPDDGPMKNGDRLLFNSIAESLCQSGVVVIEPDSPGCGKSQGNFFEMTDTDREADVKACVNYMSQHPLVDPKKIDLVGRRGGSYISLLVANSCDSVRSCVLLGMPGKTAVDGAGVRWNDLQRFLRYHGLGTFNQGYMSILEKSVSENIATAKNSKEDFIFFMGNRLSAKAYKEYLDRKPYETIIRANKPLLILISREEKDYSAQAVESLQKIFSENKSASNISVLNNMPPYMGSLERTDNTVLFEVDNDLIECLKKWCK